MSEIALKEATVIRICSGDVVLYRTPELLSEPEREYLEREIKRAFPNNKVVVLSAPSSLEIIREEDC